MQDERAKGQEIAAIGISGQMHGVLLVDDKLMPKTNLITWQDQRMLGQIPEINHDE